MSTNNHRLSPHAQLSDRIGWETSTGKYVFFYLQDSQWEAARSKRSIYNMIPEQEPYTSS